MEANIIQRPKENFRSTIGGIKVNSSHFRMPISIKTFVIAGFQSKQ